MGSRILGLLVAWTLAVQGDLKAVVINGVDWSNAYQPNIVTNNNLPTVPSAVTGGVWTQGGSGGGTAVVAGDYLTIATTTAAANCYFLNGNNWSGDNGMTVEARLQTVAGLSTNTPIAQIRLGGNSASSTNKYIYISFTLDSIYYSNSAGGITLIKNGLTLTDFNTVRLTLSGDLQSTNLSALNIYLNNAPTPVGTVAASAFQTSASTNNMIFGEITGSGPVAAGGTSNWNYIAYTQGVIAPVPEPGSCLLVVVGSLALFAVGRVGRLSKARF